MGKSLEIDTKALLEEMTNKLARGYSEEEVMKIAKEPLDKIDEKKALEEKIIKHAYETLSKKVVENPRETLNDDEIENAKAALSKDELYEELYDERNDNLYEYDYDEECEKMLATYKPYTISRELYLRLKKLGIIGCNDRNYNIGSSDYSKHIIQPWSIWIDWNLNPWDADIIKRVLRTKSTDNRIMDYEKIIHVCKERIRQLKTSDK